MNYSSLKRIRWMRKGNEAYSFRRCKYDFFVVLLLLGLNIYKASAVLNLDSLKLALQNAKHDSTRCAILSALAETAPDNEWPGYNAALKNIAYKNLSVLKEGKVKTVFIRYFSMAVTNEGVILSEQMGDNESAMQKYRLSLKLSRYADDKKGEAAVLNNMGSIYEGWESTDSAIYYYDQSLKLSTAIRDKEGIANSLNNIGSVYSKKGNSIAALEYYYNALDLAVKSHNYLDEALALGKIGTIHDDQEEYDLALKNLTKAMDLFQKQGSLKDVANILNCIGTIYKKTGRLQEAYQCHLRGLEVNQRIGNVYGEGESLLGIGNCLYTQGKTKEALDTLVRALSFFDKAERKYMQIQVLNSIARIYVFEKKCKEARTYAETALRKVEPNHGFSEQAYLAETLSEIYKCVGDYKRALEMNEWFRVMSEKVRNEAIKKRSLHNQYKYEYERKAYGDSVKVASEKQLYEARLKQERANVSILLLSLALLIFLGLFIFQRIRYKQKQRVMQLRNEMASDLHDDVGAALSSIKLLAGITKSNPERAIASGLVTRMEQTSLETIDAMNDIVWSIHAKEDDFTMVLDKMRQFGERICESGGIQFEFLTDKGIEGLYLGMMQRKNIYLIFKEAINNAVKYSKGSHIRVSVSKERRQLCLRVSDNGTGFDPEANIKRGNGLGNMRRRAEEIKGHLNIMSDTSGTTITLEFKTT
ncbi:MAG: tetratricopeptide repeat protein [Sediminibacterium sp.]|nr:tetratricopeptide repeat protein [Sediminibacterium sp.]